MSEVQVMTHADEEPQRKNFSRSDDVRESPHRRLELIAIGGAAVRRAVFRPGGRWSISVKPIAKTEGREAPHFHDHVAGVLCIRRDDGAEFDCRPGAVSPLRSGNDGWAVGEEPAGVIGFQGMIDNAKSH